MITTQHTNSSKNSQKMNSAFAPRLVCDISRSRDPAGNSESTLSVELEDMVVNLRLTYKLQFYMTEDLHYLFCDLS